MDVRNVGVDSATSSDLLADNTTAGLFVAKAIAVVWEIGNSLFFGSSAAGALADYWALCDAIKAQGFRVVAVTCLPRTYPGTPSTYEADRQTCNAAIRTGWPGHADAFVDVGNDGTIGQAGQTTNTTYYTDLAHLTDAGYAIVKGYMQSALNGML